MTYMCAAQKIHSKQNVVTYSTFHASNIKKCWYIPLGNHNTQMISKLWGMNTHNSMCIDHNLPFTFINLFIGLFIHLCIHSSLDRLSFHLQAEFRGERGRTFIFWWAQSLIQSRPIPLSLSLSVCLCLSVHQRGTHSLPLSISPFFCHFLPTLVSVCLSFLLCVFQPHFLFICILPQHLYRTTLSRLIMKLDYVVSKKVALELMKLSVPCLLLTTISCEEVWQPKLWG